MATSLLAEYGERSAIMQKLVDAADSSASANSEHEREHKKLQRERDAAQAEARHHCRALEQLKQDSKVRKSLVQAAQMMKQRFNIN